MKALARVGLGVALVVLACGPDARPGGDDGDDDGGGFVDGGPPGPPPGTAMVSGTVWAPGQAPGMVPAGEEIPVAGAVIYVTQEAPPPIPDEAYCDPCQELPPGAVVSDAKGRFMLYVPVGAAHLVIEKAQFRLEQDIAVDAEFGAALTAAETTLPSVHEPASGRWIPRVAIAVGDSDHVEDIFAKMGVVAMDPDGRASEAGFAATDRLDLYGNPIDAPFASQHRGTIAELFADPARLHRYHIVFVPCNYESDVAPLAQATVRQNIRDYVAAGGKIYVTDWSAEWEDAAFPEFIAFDATIDTTAAMAGAGTINTGDGDFGHFALHGAAADPALAEWLDGQQGPVVVPLGGEELDFPSEYTPGVIDAGDFVIEGAWNLIRELPPVTLGSDAMGQPVVETAKVWIDGDYAGQRTPHTVTFEPSCGRVLYSTYHTAQKTHLGLVPQERVLLYLIMELGVCNDGPVIE